MYDSAATGVCLTIEMGSPGMFAVLAGIGIEIELEAYQTRRVSNAHRAVVA
jgi:hypothetical protein